MQRLLAALFLTTLAGLAPAAATTGSGTLTLAGGASDNKLQVTIAALGASDTDTTTLSGTLAVTLGADPATGATSVFTINGGNIAMTNMNLELKVLFVLPVATINTSGMKGTAFTAVPPGVVTPTGTGGTFDASQHHVRISEGAITGTVFATDPDTPINANFTEAPVEGDGQGTGTLTVTPGAATATHRDCAVVMTLPVNFTDTQDLEGVAVTVTVKGAIRATGTIPLPLNDWIDWTQANNLPGAPFTEPVAPGGAPLGLAWAMGYDPDATAVEVTPVMQAGAAPSALVRLGVAAARGPLLLEQSESLTGDWQPVPPAAVSGGQNPLPAGTAGEITVELSAPAGRRFVRVAATQP